LTLIVTWPPPDEPAEVLLEHAAAASPRAATAVTLVITRQPARR
jgi:hypothetical protein